MARNDLIATAAVAELLGVNRQRVHQLRRVYHDFPKPIRPQTGRAFVWHAGEVNAWLAKHPQRPVGTRLPRKPPGAR